MEKGILIASAVIGVIALYLVIVNVLVSGFAGILNTFIIHLMQPTLLVSGIYIAVRLAISDFRK